MSQANGEDLEERQRRQQEMQLHNNNLANGQAQGGGFENSIVPEFLESKLEDSSVGMLENLLVPDLVLANFERAEAREWKIKIRRLKRIFLARHPPQKCHVTGDDRVYINDDADDSLTPLSPRQKEAIEHFFAVLETRPTRAIGMRQQEVFQTSISESVVRNKDEEESDSGGRFGGILGRVR